MIGWFEGLSQTDSVKSFMELLKHTYEGTFMNNNIFKPTLFIKE